MTVFRLLKKTAFLLAVVVLIVYGNVSAQQVMILSEHDPKGTQFSAFNSYQHKLLLVSLIQKEKSPFQCLPNNYLFYDFGKEDFFEITAGNLKIDNTYTKLLSTKIHTLGGVTKKNQKEWEKRIKNLLQELNVSAQTLEQGKMISQDKSLICWQQPELINLLDKTKKTFPILAANLCKSSWCSELYWKDSQHMQFWVQIDPKKYHLMRLNTKSGKSEFIKEGPKFSLAMMKQANAPRDDLVTDKNMAGKSVVLTSRNGKNVRLVWKKLKNGRIQVSLQRAKKDDLAARRIQTKIAKKIKQKRIPEGLQLIKFALWLDPDNRLIKIQRLEAYASLLMVDELFKSLKTDFSKTQRFSACQKLHIEDTFKNLWKRENFIKQFKENCS